MPIEVRFMIQILKYRWKFIRRVMLGVIHVEHVGMLRPTYSRKLTDSPYRAAQRDIPEKQDPSWLDYSNITMVTSIRKNKISRIHTDDDC